MTDTDMDQSATSDLAVAAGKEEPERAWAQDVVPEESDNGPRPGDGTIEDQDEVRLPSGAPGGGERLAGPTPGSVLAAAAHHLGTIEHPAGSNRQPFGAAYGMNGVAWCNIFVSEVGHQATGGYGFLGKYAYTPSCASWWSSRGRFGHQPRPGSVVFFDWGGSRSIQAIDHIGLVVQPLANGLVRTIEGNAAVPGHPDGVWYHDRSARFIVGYGYPAYGGSVPEPVVPDDHFGPYRHCAVRSRELRVLDAGDDVKVLQQRLHITVDGEFGAITKHAVRAYQRTHHLTADGVVGRQTWDALLGRVPPTPDVAPRYPGLLRRGSTGTDVRHLQRRLKDRGWHVRVDGSFGPATETIVRAFQKDKGLASDGAVGRRTWTALWTAPVT